MSAPFYVPRTPRKPPVEPDPQMPDPQFPDEADGILDLIWASYSSIRFECSELEAYIEAAEKRGPLTEKDRMRLDKAVTVMKVGFKIVKKVARRATGTPPPLPDTPAPARTAP